MRKFAFILFAVGGVAFALFIARIGLSRLVVRVNVQTNQTFTITGFPFTNQSAQKLALKGMAAAGLTNAFIITAPQADYRRAGQIADELTNAGFRISGMR